MVGEVAGRGGEIKAFFTSIVAVTNTKVGGISKRLSLEHFFAICTFAVRCMSVFLSVILPRMCVGGAGREGARVFPNMRDS